MEEDMRRLIVADEDLWAEIVKAWATGKQVLKDERPVPAIPRSPEELRQMWCTYRLGPEPDARITRVQHVQPDANTLLIRIPAKELVEEFEAELSATGAPYQLPLFYDIFYDKELKVPDPARRLELQALRIGDYAIGMCA
jgi:hypothetical protein